MPYREADFDDEELDESEGDAKAMTRDQLARFLDAVDQRYRLLLEFLSATGLRISEANGLDWRHLNLESDRPRVMVRRQFYRGRITQPKSKKGRRDVPIAPILARALQAHRERLGAGDNDPVFQGRGGGRVSARDVRARIIRPAADGLGLKWVTPHTLRHTAASLMFEREPSVVAVARFLGHASPQITLNTYLHLIRDEPMAPIDVDTELALEAKRAARDNKWTMQEGHAQEVQSPGRP